METRSPLKRISIMIEEAQYEQISKEGLNISAFIRGLINDYFSEHKITLAVSKKTHDVYNQVISNSGASDDDIEPYLTEVLKKVLNAQIDKMNKLKSSI